MPNNNETTTRFKVDIAELKKEFTEAKQQIKLVNSEFKAATSGMDDWTKSADGLSAKLKQLDGVLSAQKSQLSALEKQYELVVKEQGADSKGAEDLRIKINNQKAAIGDTEKQIRNYNTQLENLGTDTVDAEKKTKQLSDGFTVMKGVMTDLVSAGIKALIQGLKDLATYANAAYKEFDKGYDNLIKATGATGDAAKDVEASYKNVAKNIKGDMGVLGSAIGEVNTRFGYTGEQLEKTSEDFLKFSAVTGTDATQAVRLVSRAMENAGIDASEYGTLLDQLTVAGQASGISVDRLAESLTKNGSQMRAMGYDTEETIALLAKWEKAGVNADTMLAGMKTAFKEWSDQGKDSKREFERIIRTISLTSDSTEAAKIAIDNFGKKAGPELAEMVKRGEFEYSDFLKLVKDSPGTVSNTYEQTQDAFDKIALAAQGLKVDVATAFKGMLNEYGPDLDKIIEKVRTGITKAFGYFISDILPKIKDGIKWIVDNLPKIEALVVAIGTAFLAWKAVAIITAVTTALQGMTAAEIVLAAKQALLNAVMAANPIGLIVGAIAGLVAAFVVLWNKSDEFRQFWIDLWESIQETVGDAIDGIRAVWEAVVEFFKGIWDSIQETAMDAWEAIGGFFTAAGDAIQEVWTAVKDFFITIWEAIKDIFSSAWDKITEIFSGAWEGIKKIWDAVSGYFKMIWENIKGIFSVVKAVLTGDFKGAWDGIKGIWDNTTGYFKKLWENVKKIFSVVKDFFKNAFSSAWEAVKGVFSGVGEFFSGIWETITSKFKSIGTAIGDAIGGAFKTAINAVIATVEKGLNVIPNVVNAAIDLINELPGVEISPLSTISLPRLARGGVLKRGQVGLLEGSGAEAVVPLDQNDKWLDEIANRLRIKLDTPMNGASVGSASQHVTNNFYQTNNSPKALSRLEIYRQSKNLLRMKG
jgi:TP901 family phage tail tape measure protein